MGKVKEELLSELSHLIMTYPKYTREWDNGDISTPVLPIGNQDPLPAPVPGVQTFVDWWTYHTSAKVSGHYKITSVTPPACECGADKITWMAGHHDSKCPKFKEIA